MQEVYVSCDVEANGPIPGHNSMLSLGAVAFDEKGVELGAKLWNLEELPLSSPDEDTMQWWDTQPEAWKAIRKDLVQPAVAMKEFVSWVNRLPGSPVFVGYPACYDFMFVYWYLRYYDHASPFSHSGLDIKTMAMAIMGTSYRGSTKKNMPKRWFPKGVPHTHVPVDDAREQGLLFFSMMKDLRAKRGAKSLL